MPDEVCRGLQFMILSDLTTDEMAAVEKTGAPRTYARGDTIIREGDEGSSFFLILSGRVEVRKGIGGDKYKKLVDLGPLDIFGEVCFLGVVCRSASVVALEATQVMEFSRSALETLIAVRPGIGLKLYRGIAHELAQRLAAVDGDLKDAIMWALGDARTMPVPPLTGARKLSIRPPPAGGPSAKLVVV